MDIISFLCASLGSSTVQLYGSVSSRSARSCSEPCFGNQIVGPAWGVCNRRAAFYFAFLFLLTVGSVCLSKQFSLGDKFSLTTKRLKRRCRSGWDSSQRLTCCGFRRTDKQMRQVYQCWWVICGETNVLSRFEYHILYVLYPFVTYILTLPRNFILFYNNWINVQV
jgi:hypothetical protein